MANMHSLFFGEGLTNAVEITAHIKLQLAFSTWQHICGLLNKLMPVEGKLIYLLEDDTDIQYLVHLLLTRKGYRVVICKLVKEFEEQINLQLPDLCIMDVQLPDGNGLEVCRKLTAHPSRSQVPVLLMSSHRYYLTEYKAAGAWNFINKPFDTGIFLETVQVLAST